MRAGARWAGDFFLGVALGLIGYWAITGAFTAMEQRALSSQFSTAQERAQADPLRTSGPGADATAAARADARYWQHLAPGEAMGRLVAEKIGLDAYVVRGTSRAQLMKGPGWITTTHLPGEGGNFAISGHRTTYGAPFRHIDRLKKGDVIRFVTPYREYTYEVYRVFAVRPGNLSVLASGAWPTLTLTACHPPYSARQRIIVRARLIEARPATGKM